MLSIINVKFDREHKNKISSKKNYEWKNNHVYFFNKTQSETKKKRILFLDETNYKNKDDVSKTNDWRPILIGEELSMDGFKIKNYCKEK